MKIRFTPIALALMGVSVATVGSAAELTMKPGVYTATVNGHNAPMTVEVTVSEHKIEKIDASKNLETIGVGRKAIEKMTAKILDNQSIGVDAVTGATVTSSAIWSAVKQCLEQAGADMKAVTAKVEKHPSGERTIDADVVIVGGGGAGLAAAVSAHEAGAKKVVVLEKLGYLGGSTNVSEGALNAVDPARQGKQGIEDSTAKFYEQTLKGGHDKGDPELVKYLTENSLSSVEWLEAHGVKFKDEIGTATGALWQRSHYPATPSGNTYIRALEAVIDKTNGAIEVITDAEVNDLIKAEGRIAGVKAKHFGEKLTVSSDAVVITTGGFGANVKLRQEVNTGVWKHVVLDNKIGTTNINKAAQGQGMDLAKKYGAQLIGLDDIQLHPCGTPGTGLMENIRTSGRNRIFVNVDGDRFVNEGAARDVLANAIIKQPKGTYWIVVNKVRYPARDWVDANGATIRDMVALGSVVEADSLDDLAKKTGMDAGKLKASIDGYNKIVKDGAKDPLGFVANNKADTTLTEGPWYACQKVVTVHHTMGGIKINTKAEVIGTDGKVIPGLYAAGEVTGGIHGSNRLGGNAIADVMLFGRTAGAEAAAFAKSH